VPAGAKVIVPVAGVKPEQLTDTFNESRSEGRMHDAIDIPAPAGTPVLAAIDGEIVKFFDSEKGGITIYQISADRKYFFYYAHLQRRAEDVSENQLVRMGKVIGYVGDTGNAGPGNYHLHFAITSATDPKRFWDGISVNPYEVLTGKAELR
jgi:murein DD-endopeptidase MepM/ murein hydrolase activator NlpD